MIGSTGQANRQAKGCFSNDSQQIKDSNEAAVTSPTQYTHFPLGFTSVPRSINLSREFYSGHN